MLRVDQAEPLANRSNGWRYRGPRGVTYRRQAVFGTGFRVRISFPSSARPGHMWFNSHPLGGDPNLYNFQTWARTVLQSGMVHPRDAEAWRTARIDVDTQGIPISLVNLQVRSGVDSQSPFFRQLNIATFGHRVVRYAPIAAFGKKWQEQQLPGACLALVVSAADDTWRVIFCWASAGRRIDVDTQGIPISLVNLQVRSGVDSQSPFFRQLNIATFGHRVVRYAPIAAFGKKWQEQQLPGACLAVLVADA
ncbi:unnamed protein product [Ectocarpus sp. CCAP 1310/34]|nr:unnamed protein product [Ectocarpus sp. CCAP 1310/34]